MLGEALLAWFDAHRRDLPWRATRDPYRIWVAEVMLQRRSQATMEKALGSRYGGSWRLEQAGDQVRHGITYRALVLHVHPACFSAGESVAEGPEAAWVAAAEMTDYPLSSVVAKILKL